MALSGDVRDLYVNKFHPVIEHELQQKGSVLRNTIRTEPGMMGEKNYFKRYGAIDQVEELSSRFDPITLNELTAERRIVSPRALHEAVGLDELDLMRESSSPQSETVQSVSMSMGRQLDKLILGALAGTAARDVGGSTSNASFDDTNNTIAVSTNTYASTTLSGETGLHEGKLINALYRLEANEVDTGQEEVFCVASARVLTQLRARLSETGQARRDFVDKTPLTVPGLDKALDGFLGIRFIRYNELSQTTQLSSGDEYAYIYIPSCAKLGFWKDLTIDVSERKDMKGFPIQVAALMECGATRMDEKKIVRILCNV